VKTPAVMRVLDTARAALAGQYDVLEACVDIDLARHELIGVPDDIMKVFLVVSSEADALPLGIDRRNWEPEALRQKDIEAERYRNAIGDVVRDALRALIATLEAQA